MVRARVCAAAASTAAVVQYHLNKMYTEALNAYATIVKNKQYAQAGRLRVNMGNIYYEEKKYPQAIKMYRMAVDQVNTSISAALRLKIQVRSTAWESFPA
ncbi:MAG: hypothetical protein EOO65_05290 [Methanosarcinales archaeon]|nr:MAG: hypothetical protein EOO65_05290 [Methanosarcinales archaeon]